MFSANSVKQSRAWVCAAIFALFVMTLSHAGKALADPSPNDNPMLAQYVKDGIKLFYLGNRSGLDGWFLFKDNQIQVMYTTADKQSLIIGALYGTNGEAVTEDQVRALSNVHPEIGASLQQNLTIIRQNSLTAAGTIPPINAIAAPQTPPGEKLVQELQEAGSVDLGDHKAPQLFMIMDPNCPHCQATWKALRDAVFKKDLQIRLIPIGRNDEDERVAAVLLRNGDPLNAWDKYVGGDKSQLAGEADPLTLATVKTNHTLIDRWSISETPYIVYRGKDKQIKVLVGEPQKIETLLTDVGPG